MSLVEKLGALLQNTKFQIFGGVVLVAGGVFLGVKKYNKKKLLEKRKNYPRDVVILHQIGRCKHTPSVSPFALKVETWLRMAGIKYQNDFSFEFSSKKLFPWITYNDVDVPDSQLSIEYLSKKLNKNLNSKLSDKEAGIARCVLKTCEESARWCGVLHRFVYSCDPKETGLPPIFYRVMKPRVQNYTYNQGYGRHSKEEVYEIGKADLKAINDVIGTNKFLLGDEPCDTDASIFGLMCQVLYNDRGPFNEYVTKSCPNILRHVETMKERYWPDWNDCLRKSKSATN